ncbi:hypothetical protein [Candidatus Enterococcus clewellii]|uniref:Glycosyl transferase family 1 domain-containing protein n=1 Tax=Candidatus Enterococcus clewellii TaxID=1834193 RepID=A0A242K6C0_9ENTE|nr:hypothetical protein [Enterococcus sp. 9E7_DIV0242]OTP14694.1 hypothetical protein A5888_002795 [Enterococcus sp. 9E7_DIV0242]
MNSPETNILVISNNAFSETGNNGKTLAAVFSGLKNVNVAQLYFKNEQPSSNVTELYFRVTDKDMLNSFFSLKKRAGDIVNTAAVRNNEVAADSNDVSASISRNQLTRIFREIIWKKKSWKNDKLFSWIDSFNPNIIFFCAGDSEFAYDIVKVVQERYKTRLCTYITDDYILPRENKSLLFELRRKRIKRAMGRTIEKSDLLFVISDKMNTVYETIFGKKSIVLKNMSESLLIEGNMEPKQTNKEFSFVYAGGLHFNRDKSLMELASVLDKYNTDDKNQKKAKLHLYTKNTIDENDFARLTGFESVEYHGFVSSDELKLVLNRCDVPVHVEAFDKESVESTRLSLSTKIPEYMSLNKPILAIGPAELASISYLTSIACCVTDIDDLESEVGLLLSNQETRDRFAKKSFLQYKEEYNIEKFEKRMSELFGSLLL